MTESAQLSFGISFKGTLTKLLAAGSSMRSKISHTLEKLMELGNGVSANQANFIFGDDSRALAGSGTEDLDLYDLGTFNIGAGAGLDGLGQAVTLAKLVAMIFHNSKDSVGDLLIGGKAATTAFNTIFNDDDDAVVRIPPGATVVFFAPELAGYPIADTTNHLLKIAASAAGAVTYSFAIAARKS